jgi:uncharacterized protein YqfA (UPF0365 family)
VAEGLTGKGEFADKREITTKGLAEFVIKRVDQLAKDMKAEQEPQYFRGSDAEDCVLARRTEGCVCTIGETHQIERRT